MCVCIYSMKVFDCVCSSLVHVWMQNEYIAPWHPVQSAFVYVSEYLPTPFFLVLELYVHMWCVSMQDLMPPASLCAQFSYSISNTSSRFTISACSSAIKKHLHLRRGRMSALAQCPFSCTERHSSQLVNQPSNFLCLYFVGQLRFLMDVVWTKRQFKLQGGDEFNKSEDILKISHSCWKETRLSDCSGVVCWF